MKVTMKRVTVRVEAELRGAVHFEVNGSISRQ